MSYLTTQPQLMSVAAENLAGIQAALTEANAAVAGPTTGLAAAAADEVSAAAAQMFGAFGQEYQAVIGQAAAFHEQFNRALSAASSAYAEAEIANAAQVLGTAAASPIEALFAPLLAPVQSLLAPVQSALLAPFQSLFGAPATGGGGVVVTEVPPSPFGPYDVALIMSGSGTPIPPPSYLTDIRPWITAAFGVNNPVSIGLSTPEGLYPLTAIKDLTLQVSVDRGVQILHDALFGANGLISTGEQSVSVLGYSQSAILASLELRNLMATGMVPSPDVLSFTLLGNPMNPNGGLLARFPGLSLPAIGLDFYGAQPTGSGLPVNTYTLQYDGYADFPKYPLNFLADLNAFLGIQLVHGNYPDLNPNALPPGYELVQLPVSPENNGLDQYYMITYPGLPLLEPIRAIPLIGNPLADLVEPNLTYLVNLGYGDPNYGYNTGYADVHTPFELFPPIPATFVSDQIALAGQGLNAFAGHFTAPALPALSLPELSALLPTGGGSGGLSLPFSLPGATGSPISGIIDGIQAANTNITTAITSAAADTYAVALPTADIVNTLLTTVPSYNLNLFLDGIEQFANGDPAGLINAFGKPIAANVAVGTLAAGFEFVVLSDAISDVIDDLTGIATYTPPS